MSTGCLRLLTVLPDLLLLSVAFFILCIVFLTLCCVFLLVLANGLFLAID
jgi:hypothetical protein